jgi:hypothetical protein
MSPYTPGCQNSFLPGFSECHNIQKFIGSGVNAQCAANEVGICKLHDLGVYMYVCRV